MKNNEIHTWDRGYDEERNQVSFLIILSADYLKHEFVLGDDVLKTSFNCFFFYYVINNHRFGVQKEVLMSSSLLLLLVLVTCLPH